MKKIDLGQTISILANLGVIAGIVFLGFETRQNNALLQQQSRAIGVQQYFDTLGRLIDDPTLLALRITDSDSLTPIQLARLQLLEFRSLAAWEYQWGEWRRGLIDDEEMADNQRIWGLTFKDNPKRNEHWNAYKETRANPEFARWLEDNVVNRR